MFMDAYPLWPIPYTWYDQVISLTFRPLFIFRVNDVCEEALSAYITMYVCLRLPQCVPKSLVAEQEARVIRIHALKGEHAIPCLPYPVNTYELVVTFVRPA